MAAAKKKPTTSRVSPSKRGEGSKPKPKTTRVSPSARKEGATNVKAMLSAGPKKTAEAGVGNIPATVARAAMTIAKHLSKTSKSSKPSSTSKSTGKSNKAYDTAEDRRAIMEHNARTKRVQEAKQKKSTSDYERSRAAAEKIKRESAYRPRRSGTPLGPPR